MDDAGFPAGPVLGAVHCGWFLPQQRCLPELRSTGRGSLPRALDRSCCQHSRAWLCALCTYALVAIPREASDAKRLSLPQGGLGHARTTDASHFLRKAIK